MVLADRDRNNEWFDFARSCLSDSKWEMAANRPEASLSHRTCPWGGHLIRFDSRKLFIQNAPENPRDFLVRPEVRAMYEGSEIKVQWRETLAPGEAVLERSTSMWVMKMASVLFGNFQGLSNFFYDSLPTLARHQLRRDFPESGDCTYVGQECLLISRREPGERSRFQVVLVFRTPEDRWAHWAWPLYAMITDMYYKAMVRFLNRPEAQDMRATDSNFYLVLAMRSFNRGPPMIPHRGTDPAEITISSGQDMGLASWSRFCSSRKGFVLAEYLKVFVEKLGYNLQTYETLDSCKLVPYQCVVKRSDWEQLRESFTLAFRLQKAAYRRANGGKMAPSLVEDAEAHWTAHGKYGNGCFLNSQSEALPQATMIKTVVRNTFLELEEDLAGNDEDDRPMRRTKSDALSDALSL